MVKQRIISQQKQVQHFVEEINGVPLQMILIPSGSFIMGAPTTEEDSRDNERPQHRVTVPLFFMGRYPVTQAQWRAIAALPKVERDLNPDPSRFKGENRPVEKVNWYDALEACVRLSRYSKRNYRLPTEAEWEYACRARSPLTPLNKGGNDDVGAQGLRPQPPQGLRPDGRLNNEELTIEAWNKSYHQPFYFGETISTELANYQGTDNEPFNWSGSYGRGEKGIYREETTEVGYFKAANEFGLSDMHGNVWEWCLDPYNDNYDGAPNDGTVFDKEKEQEIYQNIDKSLAILLNDKRNRILRGGSWFNLPWYCRSAYRYNFIPRIDYLNFSLRLVCAVPDFL